MDSPKSAPGDRPVLFAKTQTGAMVMTAAVLDLSIVGCVLDWYGLPLVEGQRVLISFPKVADLPAVVRSIGQNEVGFSFDEPLQEAVFERMWHKYRGGS